MRLEKWGGAPIPHGVNETRTLFCAIDYLVRTLEGGQYLVEHVRDVYQIFSEVWHDIYEEKANVNAGQAQILNLALLLAEKTVGKDHIVLYPFGGQGQRIKAVLNTEFGVQEAFVLDKNPGTQGNIRTLESLKDIDAENYLYLLASDDEYIHQELLENLYQHVPRSNVIDLYPKVCE